MPKAVQPLEVSQFRWASATFGVLHLIFAIVIVFYAKEIVSLLNFFPSQFGILLPASVEFDRFWSVFCALAIFQTGVLALAGLTFPKNKVVPTLFVTFKGLEILAMVIWFLKMQRLFLCAFVGAIDVLVLCFFSWHWAQALLSVHYGRKTPPVTK